MQDILKLNNLLLNCHCHWDLESSAKMWTDLTDPGRPVHPVRPAKPEEGEEADPGGRHCCGLLLVIWPILRLDYVLTADSPVSGLSSPPGPVNTGWLFLTGQPSAVPGTSDRRCVSSFGATGLTFIAFAELVAVMYVYGHKKFTDDIHEMTGTRLQPWHRTTRKSIKSNNC